MRHTLLALFTATILLITLAGCASAPSRIEPAEVWGYGTGPSSFEAERAAYDDANARIGAMGFGLYSASIVSRQSGQIDDRRWWSKLQMHVSAAN